VATRASVVGSGSFVQITSWRIVGGPLPFGNTITQAYLNQFVGVFSFESISGRYIELKCFPTPSSPCLVSNIFFGVYGQTFCYAEFDVGEKRKRDTSPLDDTRVVGGTLLSPNPFT